MSTAAIPIDYCSDCRPLYGLPPTTKPVGTYDTCPACNPDIPILSCPEHRSPALADLALPANQYYYCQACGDEWVNEPTASWRSHDYAVALLALTWLTFQCGVYFLLMLGFVLVLTQNYGYTPEDAILPAAGYSFVAFIFWITVLFPALLHLVADVGERAWRAVWGQSL